MGNQKRKYKLNEDWPTYPNAAVNGISFDADTVVEGEQWEKYTRAMFANKPPQLIQTTDDTVVTKPALGTPAARQETRERPKPVPNGPSGAFSTTVMQMDEERTEAAPEAPKQKGDAPPPPVKVLKPEHEKRAEEKAAAEEAADLELIDIPGVAEGRAGQLKEAGYDGVKSVAGADPHDMLSALKSKGARMNLATAKSIVKSAKELLRG